MCAFKAHIKFFIFRNIFSKIEKVVITFSIIEKFFSKMKINVCLHTLVKSYKENKGDITVILV